MNKARYVVIDLEGEQKQRRHNRGCCIFIEIKTAKLKKNYEFTETMATGMR